MWNDEREIVNFFNSIFSCFPKPFYWTRIDQLSSGGNISFVRGASKTTKEATTDNPDEIDIGDDDDEDEEGEGEEGDETGQLTHMTENW